ncbi:hypothetical protein [Microbacterium petrolearium]
MMGKKEEPGDGSALPRARGIRRLWHSTFGIDHAGRRYDVAVDYFDLDERVRLYIDGQHTATQSSPAAFEVPGGRVEVAFSLYGLKRARLVADGVERRLEPGTETLERWRQEVDARHPTASRAVSAVSWTVLVVALLVGVTELLDVGLPWLAEITGADLPQASPIRFPEWMTAPAAVLGPIAAIDRALMMRHHWLLDD